jgi:predicted 2-oxoglutarate/Fe(II)-dependent dioxygenase YbiX
MQVALNDPSEYIGGRLMYATEDGRLLLPDRKEGSVTLHNNTVVHGVTPLKEGVRYGLFFLKKGDV